MDPEPITPTIIGPPPWNVRTATTTVPTKIRISSHICRRVQGETVARRAAGTTRRPLEFPALLPPAPRGSRKTVVEDQAICFSEPVALRPERPDDISAPREASEEEYRERSEEEHHQEDPLRRRDAGPPVVELSLAHVSTALGLVVLVLSSRLAHDTYYRLGVFGNPSPRDLFFEICFWFGLEAAPGVLVAPLVVGGFGIAIERGLLQWLYKLDPIYGLLLIFGLALVIEGLFRD